MTDTNRADFEKFRDHVSAYLLIVNMNNNSTDTTRPRILMAYGKIDSENVRVFDLTKYRNLERIMNGHELKEDTYTYNSVDVLHAIPVCM